MAGLGGIDKEECHLSETSPEEKSHIHDLIIIAPVSPFNDLTIARGCGVVKEVLECEDTAYLAPYYNMMTEAESYIEKDDKAEFKYFLEINKELVNNFPASDLLYLICKGNAPGCAAAFLDSGFHVDLNEPLYDGYYPLEYAARYLSHDLTQILLQHGANPNVFVKDYDHVYDHDQLILGVALDELCNNEYVKQWNPEKSIFKLFYLLCLPALKGPLDTIYLLASTTEKDDVNGMLYRLLSNYEFFGRSESFLQLIALLKAEKDNLLVPCAEAGGILESTSFWQLFSDRFSKTLKRLYNELETLWRAIDVLDHYRHSPIVKSVSKRQVPFVIARALMNEANLELKPEDVYCDDIDCLRPLMNKSNAEDFEKQFMQESVGSSLHSSCCKSAMSTSWLSSSSIPSSPARAYHKFHNVNFNMKNLVEVQRSKVIPMKPASHNVLGLGKICAPLIRIAKRGIK